MRFNILIESIASLIVFNPKSTLSFTTSTISGSLGIPITEQPPFFLLEYNVLKHPVISTYVGAPCKTEFNYPCNSVSWQCPFLHQEPQYPVKYLTAPPTTPCCMCSFTRPSPHLRNHRSKSMKYASASKKPTTVSGTSQIVIDISWREHGKK